MTDPNELLQDACERAARYLRERNDRPVTPGAGALEQLNGFRHPLPAGGTDPAQVLARLDDRGSPATVVSSGGRYFGFVTGGALPAALAANWLAGAWDQNVALRVMSPVAAVLEETALGWARELLGLPEGAAGACVTGATMANFTALAAARHALLARKGWDVEADGLFGAPEISVVVGAEAHVSLLKALALLGLGRARVHTVPADEQGRMRADLLHPLGPATLVCLQAGNVNTGAFDPANAVCRAAREAGAWVHVDGAFGLWAAAAPERAHHTHGYEKADSWATDAHKWLNVPYDSGLVFVRDGAALRSAMATNAAYLRAGDQWEPMHHSPESSRRARGVDLWAGLLSLGREGVADLVERTCRHAARFADGLRTAGHEVLNDVVLNQVLVAFGDDETTRAVIRYVQEEGVCWCGGTRWHEREAMRISVSSWATSGEDVELSLEAILRAARTVRR